jgi:hypothetical protein
MSELAVSNIPNHITALFSNNWGHDVQQMVARLRPFVTIESEEIPGDGKRYDDYAATENLEKATGRAGPTRRKDVTSTSRWLLVVRRSCRHTRDRSVLAAPVPVSSSITTATIRTL